MRFNWGDLHLNRDELKEYYAITDDEVQMPMDFMFCHSRQTLPRPECPTNRKCRVHRGWPVYVIGNHDMPRSYERYGDGKHNDQIAKLYGRDDLTLRGTPIINYAKNWG